MNKNIKLENQLLWMFVNCVAKEGKCECGSPPFENGNLCNTCMAIFLLDARTKDKKS